MFGKVEFEKVEVMWFQVVWFGVVRFQVVSWRFRFVCGRFKDGRVLLVGVLYQRGCLRENQGKVLERTN